MRRPLFAAEPHRLPTATVLIILTMLFVSRASAYDPFSALNAASEEMQSTMRASTEALTRTAAQNRTAMEQFDQTVGKFNTGVHDFTEVDYNLRGSVERMDLAVRDLAAALRGINRRMEGEQK